MSGTKILNNFFVREINFLCLFERVKGNIAEANMTYNSPYFDFELLKIRLLVFSSYKKVD
jgi:hypothetical protein